jgi:hypothetical protein
MLAKWMPPGFDGEPLQLFRTLAVHDGLFGRMRPLGAGILGQPRLLPRDREILILRTCARAGAEYEWGVHARAFGGAVGLTDQQIAATANARADDPAWSEDDSRLVAAADSLFDDDSIPDSLWSALAARLRDDQLLELVIVVGWYRLISDIIRAVGLDPEPWAARFPPVPAAGRRDQA